MPTTVDMSIMSLPAFYCSVTHCHETEN